MNSWLYVFAILWVVCKCRDAIYGFHLMICVLCFVVESVLMWTLCGLNT